MLENTARTDQAEGYPTYNVEQRDEDSYQISIPVVCSTATKSESSANSTR